MFAVGKKPAMRDTKWTLCPKFATKMRSSCSSLWNMLSWYCKILIGFMQLPTNSIKRRIWISKLMCFAVVIFSILVGVMWRRSRCCLNSLSIPTLLAQDGNLHTIAVEYCPCSLLSFCVWLFMHTGGLNHILQCLAFFHYGVLRSSVMRFRFARHGGAIVYLCTDSRPHP